MSENESKNSPTTAQNGGAWKRAQPKSGSVPKNSSVQRAKSRRPRLNRLSQSISGVGKMLAQESGETMRKMRMAKRRVWVRVIPGADYKQVLNDYLLVFKKITKTLLQEFWQLSSKYDIKPLVKFDRENFKAAFRALKTAASKTVLTERLLKATFKVVDEKTGQTNTRPDAYMGPYLIFAQIFVKLPLFLKDLLKSLGSLLQLKSLNSKSMDDEIKQEAGIRDELRHIRDILGEMKATIYENPEVLIPVNSLSKASLEAVEERIKFLERFSCEVKQIADKVQRVPEDAIKQELEFTRLRNQCRF